MMITEKKYFIAGDFDERIRYGQDLQGESVLTAWEIDEYIAANQ